MPDKKMNKSQLYEALTKILNLPVLSDDFDELYQKMNLMRDDGIKWNELLSYFLLGLRVKGTTVPASQLFDLPIIGLPKIINSRHRSFICRIIFSSEISNNTTASDQSSNFDRGHYLTASRDGMINYWSIDFTLQRRIDQKHLQLKAHSMITDMIAMTDVKMICLSSTERKLSFYDIAANKFELRMQVYAIVCMNYYYSTSKFKHSSYIVMGDTSGSVKFIIFNPTDRGPFKQRIKRDILNVHYDIALKNKVRGLKLKELNHIHTNWVSQVNYYGHFNVFISCSRCSKCSLLLGDPIDRKINYSFNVSMGISCFTLDEEKQLLFTGGPDCLVRIWNPFDPKKPNAILRGHQTTICTILSLKNNNQLFTLSKDRCIKVWDYESHACIQTYNRLPSELSEHTPMSVIYNSAMKKIIIGSMMIVLLTCGKIIDEDLSDGETHSRQITCVLYNPLFKIITTGADSRIMIWDPWRARRYDMISNAHDELNFFNESVHVEITAATFDYSYQLLITGGRDGSLKIWNFNTGTCVRKMSIENKCEITGIIWLENRILCVGWNQYVTEFADTRTGIYRKAWRKRHTDDILCAAVRHPHALATGSHNGEIVLWLLETGQPYKSYNVVNPANKDNRNSQLEKKNKDVDLKEINDDLNNNQSTFIFMQSVAVRAILFLCSRRTGSKIGTLIVSLNSGMIQMWSHHHDGGFIKAFSAIHIDGDCCLCHKEGYIKVWLMKNYGLPTNLYQEINFASLRIEFPFLWKDRILRRAKRAVKNQPLPLLVSSFKGHLKPINSIEFIPGANLIISSDHSVRMWSLGGRYISTLGSFKDWKTILPDIPVNHYFEDYRIPPDVKKVASSTTMKVLMGGIIARESQQIEEIDELKLLPDDKDERNILYGDRVDESIIKDDNFASHTPFYDHPMLDNSMEYIPVYTHLKTHKLTTISSKINLKN
ncbi:hypothetical protein PV328_001756 [Microctonus aethiopoides]|uniref:WD repeat-containing protein on Y chromosome n=1 Tax=Microctonus aethiopoides TaxID=144406 RepID=A0AA39FXV7_9HYME|nr:hypothetical protein PV328_001756 [Microctonus aethiopoides]